MQPPSSDIEPADLLARIMQSPRPSKVVPFPRKGAKGQPIGEVRLIVLTQHEAMAAAAESERTTRKLLKEVPAKEEQAKGYTDVYNSAAGIELLFRACKDPADTEMKRPLFRSKADIGEFLSQDEIAVLIQEYLYLSAEVGPQATESTSQEELDAWIEKLAQGGERIPLGSLSMGLVSQLLRYMAKLLWSLRMASSSPGTPQDEVTSS